MITFATFVVETDDTPAVLAKQPILGQVWATGFGHLPHKDLDNGIIWQNSFRTFDRDRGELVCRAFILGIFH